MTKFHYVPIKIQTHYILQRKGYRVVTKDLNGYKTVLICLYHKLKILSTGQQVKSQSVLSIITNDLSS